MKTRFIFFSFIVAILSISCSSSVEKSVEKTPFDKPPKWSEEAVWYQLFVERFRNGDKSNDPVLENITDSWIEPYPDDWAPTDWGFNWYDQEPWAKKANLEFYSSIQMRRYGGDMQGILDKVDYLTDLGITAIYFNPINDAPSLHKFDARNYRHVDIHFGPDPVGDKKIIAGEDPVDPSTWKMTSADKQFFELVDILHKNNIKVIVDFSWNHTGQTFWAFEDLKKNQSKSKYKDWYEVKSFDDPATEENEFEYDGWLGISTLPDIKKIRDTEKRPGHPYEGNMVEEPKQHIFNVCKKYMDPNGDGDPSDGIDGMRLDVAEHVPLGFWRDFRKHVRSINPDFYLVGENWWTAWPDTLMDPAPWVKGDIFDAVMHYQWYKPARHYFHKEGDQINPHLFQKSMDSVFLKYPAYTQRAMMNMAASHDSPRLTTSFSNRNKYKYNASARGDSLYNEGPVTDQDYEFVKLFLFHQFTWIGSPQLWMGDEFGMFGGDDPDNRKPLLWEDVRFDIETNSSFSARKYKHQPKARMDIHQTYKDLIHLRKSLPELIYGEYRFLDLQSNVLAYERTYNNESSLIVINTDSRSQQITLPNEYKGSTIVYSHGKVEKSNLTGRSGMILKLME